MTRTPTRTDRASRIQCARDSIPGGAGDRAPGCTKHGRWPRASALRKTSGRVPALRPARVLAVALLALALALLAPVGAARAQADAYGRSELPGQNSVDAEIDPFPFDGRLAIRSYFRERLPTMWWAGEPLYNLGRFSVTIHVPDMWRGNPTSALMALCPQPHSNLWTGLKEIELQVMYRNAPWPGITCRP